MSLTSVEDEVLRQMREQASAASAVIALSDRSNVLVAFSQPLSEVLA